MSERMWVTVNGEPHEVKAGTTVAELVEALCGSAKVAARGIAVALDREVVPRSAWASVVVQSGEHVEVVSAVAGG